MVEQGPECGPVALVADGVLELRIDLPQHGDAALDTERKLTVDAVGDDEKGPLYKPPYC